ncbi:MAG: glycosyltransferase [Caldithrix sp.]|nr:MAG: glycosyltransferase [Caldithrix sp.]
MSNKSKGLTIVPAFNEENNISTTIKEFQNCRINLDVLIIDDGSIGATAEVARSNDVPVVSLPFNLWIGGEVHVCIEKRIRLCDSSRRRRAAYSF